MSEPISTVVKVASTPEQAKIFVAMLRNEGIPAFTDGHLTQDEFAMSQRLMNQLGCRVLVPTAAVDKAREILESTDVDQDELMRQAMESADDPDAEREED